MTSIKVDKLPKIDKFEWASTISYPAILLGNMGVDNKFWKRGIGSRICNYCVGLAAEESEKIGCRYIILHTKTRETFYKKLGFVTSGDRNKNGTITMYKRLTYKRALFEYVSLKENVSIKVTRAADLNKNQHSNNKT
jgi:predicted N-acetyltransferase YhbS